MEILVAKKIVGKFGQLALWVSPVVVVITGFFLTLPRVARQHPGFAQGLTILVALFVMGYSGTVAQRLQRLRPLDEVQVAQQGYAHTHGWSWGAGITVLLLMIPPVANWLIDLILALVNTTGAPREVMVRTALQVALFGGISLLVVIQTLCVIVAARVWGRRMADEGHPS